MTLLPSSAGLEYDGAGGLKACCLEACGTRSSVKCSYLLLCIEGT